MTSISDAQPKDWKYVSEGGATIVFSYIGPANPLLDGMVLRLRKIALGEPTHGPEPDDPMIEFQKKFHLPRLESVYLDQAWLKALALDHDAERPLERRQKDQIDLTRQKGVLATDLVCGDWIAVEIKPKWAFLPSAKHLSESTRHIKTQTCRFCMHSRMRRDMGEATSVGYCPLDLFSGDSNRVKKAIYGLWDAWAASGGTVNNLKIFVDGKTIQPTEEARILASDVSVNGLSTNDIRESFASALSAFFERTPVLRLISNLQRTLDILDIEGLSQLWHNTEVSEPAYAIPSPEILRYYVLAYLLSATFKDCSLIIRLDPLRPGMPTADVGLERITVIDLDPKGIERLRKWEQMDQEIANYNAGLEPKQCIDARR
ncbi:inositol-pentakisphosphate 2-kinase [Infundibulicybe gibba]|nr:inositol-pentakisphosphate 2-kinase [Infundibulicybe gibba]